MMPGRKEGRKEGKKERRGFLMRALRGLKMSQIFESMKVWIYPNTIILLLAMIQWEGFEACLGFIRVSVELELEASNNSLFPIPL
jgi:hypothetical protein